jgi:ion channel-forming bestrophin family protein
VREFDRLNELVSGPLAGHMAWLAIPFSMLVGWMYVSLDQVGESTSNPFEGGANDVPIAQISRLVEIELRELLGESELPSLLKPTNQIIL